MKIVDVLDLTLFLDPIYTNICFGIAITQFADITFFTIQPGYLREMMFTNMETATIVSIGAAGDLCSKVVVTVTSSFMHFEARQLFLAGVVAMIGLQIGK